MYRIVPFLTNPTPFSTVDISRQELVSGQACNLPNPYLFSSYLAVDYLPFPQLTQGVVLLLCSLFIYFWSCLGLQTVRKAVTAPSLFVLGCVDVA
jgi:hypothetical protein